jgi:class 3 adenylate cyclase/CheY-like chemotaxis protein
MSVDDFDRPRRDAPEQKIDPTVAENQTPSSSAQIRHTLRTPLNHIIGYSEMLLEEAGERALDEFVADLQKIRAAGKQLQTLIDDLVDTKTENQTGTPTVGSPGSAPVLFRESRPEQISSAARQAVSEHPTGHLLVIDDNEGNRDMLSRRLIHQGYQVSTAVDGRQGLDFLKTQSADLILLDVLMPEMDGYDVLKELKTDATTRDIPVIMVSALGEIESVVRCIEQGAEDYLTKPFDPVLLRARIGACLEKKRLRDQEARYLHELADWNKTLESRVEKQVDQIERLGRLQRFFSPQLAELILAGGAEDPLKTHRRKITVIFLDLRGFTAFAETSEPEEVMDVLHEYHAEMGKLILEHEGTLERFTGDGMMIFFNDPVSVPNPTDRAIRMSLAMRDQVGTLIAKWRKQGYELDFGVGIAEGYATIGSIGFEGRWDYGAIGTVTNLAARLCGEARPGQILISQQLLGMVEELIDVAQVGELVLKGFRRPITAYNILGLKP